MDVGTHLKNCPPMSLKLYVVPTICEPLVSQPIAEQNPKFMGLDITDFTDEASSLHVDLLIGSDYYWDLVTGNICRGDGGLTAIHTKLGWVLSGPVSAQGSVWCTMNLITMHVLRADAQMPETTGLDAQLRSFWELESLGIHEVEKTLYDDFASNVTFRDGRYKVPLPSSHDIITGADSEDAAFDLFTQAKNMFRGVGFNLRKFLTNSRGLQQRIGCAEGVQHVEPDIPKLSYSDETYAKVMLGAPVNSESGEHKVLGVHWNPNSDCLLFDMSELAQLAKNLQPTKRNLVSLIGKFYDTLGFLAPITIKFKILFQKLCQTKLDWDHLLLEELIKVWKELVANLSEGFPISITRTTSTTSKETQYQPYFVDFVMPPHEPMQPWCIW